MGMNICYKTPSLWVTFPTDMKSLKNGSFFKTFIWIYIGSKSTLLILDKIRCKCSFFGVENVHAQCYVKCKSHNVTTYKHVDL